MHLDREALPGDGDHAVLVIEISKDQPAAGRLHDLQIWVQVVLHIAKCLLRRLGAGIIRQDK